MRLISLGRSRGTASSAVGEPPSGGYRQVVGQASTSVVRGTASPVHPPGGVDRSRAPGREASAPWGGATAGRAGTCRREGKEARGEGRREAREKAEEGRVTPSHKVRPYARGIFSFNNRTRAHVLSRTPAARWRQHPPWRDHQVRSRQVPAHTKPEAGLDSAEGPGDRMPAAAGGPDGAAARALGQAPQLRAP